METNLTAARPSLVRRLMWPATLAVTVLGASCGGAYWCMNGSAEADTETGNSLRAHSAKEQLKNLFAEEKSELETSNAAQDPFGNTLRDAKPTPVVPVVGDRYGSYAPQATLPPIEEESQPPVEDVTRGQGPDANPLRMADTNVQQAKAELETTAPETPTEIADTREDFATASPLPVNTPTPAEPLVQEPSNPLASPLLQSQLPESAPSVTTANPFAAAPMPTSNNRYGAPTTVPTPSLPPVVDMGAADAQTASRQPMSAFPVDAAPLPTPAESQIANDHPTNTGITPTPGLSSQPGSGRPGERVLEGAQTPSLTILKLAPPEIQVGKRCTFGIRVQNSGQRTAQNVRVHDEIPLGTELVGTAPRASVSGGKVVWDLGTLSVGEERTVEMELIPTEEGELGSVATVTMAAQASAKARCTKPELALRLSSQPQVHAGEQQIVLVEITNPGSGEATGVMILETVPTGVTHEAGPALEFEIGNLAAGETRRLELVLTAEQAGRVKNTMTAKADAGLHVDASCEFEIVAPDLQVTVEGPERRFLERPATYQVSVDNPGTAPAKEIQLVTHLPKGLQFVSANNLGEYDAAAHSVIWSLAELPANERGTVELVALPVEPGQHTLQVSTKARDGLNDEIQKQVIVEGIAALMFEVVDRDDPIEVGGETGYEIRVVNQGSKAAANVQVVAIMPPGLRALSGHGDTRHTIQGDRVVFAPLPQLGPKAETTFRIQAQGVRDGDHRIKVQITTDEMREPITKEESTRVYADH